MKLPVCDDGIRPAGSSDRCFYCKHLKGGHDNGCVLLKKAVVIEMQVQYVRSVPAHWTKENIDFHLNESSCCLTSDVELLARIANDEAGPCACPWAHVRYLYDARPEDFSRLDVAVDKECRAAIEQGQYLLHDARTYPDKVLDDLETHVKTDKDREDLIKACILTLERLNHPW